MKTNFKGLYSQIINIIKTNNMKKQKKVVVLETTVKYEEVAKLLTSRKNQWVNSSMIVKNLPELKGSVQVRKAINTLRTVHHLPIISSSSGYMLTSNRQEVEDCIKDLKGRAKKIKQAAKGLSKSLKKLK